jgi:hypothetical protein
MKHGVEAEMFARHVSFHLKQNAAREFRPAFENEILPLLRRQHGFIEELVMFEPYRKEALTITLWEEKMYADEFHREVYPELATLLNKFTEGIPIVKDYEVEYATIPSFEKFATVTAA